MYVIYFKKMHANRVNYNKKWLFMYIIAYTCVCILYIQNNNKLKIFMSHKIYCNII
jgi:hypothetical protein